MQLEFNLERFENSAHQNGIRYWIAHEFMVTLGYETWASFQNVINKAMASCASLNVQIQEVFIPDVFVEGGKEVSTFRLTRFGCFLVTMHADSKKPQVAQAKTVLAAIADALVEQQIQKDALERIEVRDELKGGESIMSGIAYQAGLQTTEFGIFKDAGFRGMYNLSLQQLIKHKGATIEKGRTLYDFMGKTELAANLFRVTQTAERIKNVGASGVRQLSSTAQEVGKEVRNIMLKSSGIAPEHLPLDEDITKVKGQLKSAAKEMKKLDGPKKASPKKASR
ncbi:MAG TPA: BRO family protein [Novimethylophilus sp.]|jgi:DNA-damage-inducible protein D|uniref:BRO family protein n=1 Tax=Novimethylophilus sp. TaxID=2137426 RepID=UPI002F422308